MSEIDRYIAAVIERAGHEARDDGSAAMEAHHLLLAIAAADDPTTRPVLAEAGLNREAIRDALDREFERSLAAAGAKDAAGATVPGATTSRNVAPPPPGASFKLALERGFRLVDRKRDLRPAHLLLGIVQAEVGTVPRALALAGVDPAGLAERIRRSVAVRDGD